MIRPGYLIVRDGDLDRLAQRISEKMFDGYSPVGGLVRVADRVDLHSLDGHKTHTILPIFAQAMVDKAQS